MRLIRLSISGFRGFPSTAEFHLDGNAIILIGHNGQGKTSLFDAILWATTGSIPRLENQEDVLSLYSDSGEARVELELGEKDRKARLVRSTDGTDGQFSLHLDDQVFRGEIAQAQLHQLLWPDATFAPDSVTSLSTAITRSVYLQQDLIRTFLESSDDEERFGAFAELAGAGRVNELTVTLERQKKAWNTATNKEEQEIQAGQLRLAQEEGQLATLSDASGAVAEGEVKERWQLWWEKIEGYEGVVEEPLPQPSGIEAGAYLDRAIKSLDAQRLALHRRVANLEALSTEVEEGQTETSDPVNLQSLICKSQATDAEVQSLREKIQAAGALAAEQRRRLTERRQADEELRSLAELALRHYEGPCPVCGQEHDEVATKGRLENLIEKAGRQQVEGTEAEAVSGLAKKLQSAEQLLGQAQKEQNVAELQIREQERKRKELADRLKELGVESADPPQLAPKLKALTRDEQAKADAIDALQADGERLSLQLSRAGERTRREELEKRIETRRAEIARMNTAFAHRRQTSDLANQILTALREASHDVVTAQLERIQPLLQRIYSTADPHPSLTAVQLASTISRGRGRLRTPLADSVGSVQAERPEAVLSSSQLNALAVSVFLALNLGVPSIPIKAAMLDDPLQSLDDVNLLGLVDLLRRTKDRRQLFVSTHDKKFGQLLARKLRPVSENESTRVIELEAWNRQGPLIAQYEVPRDSEILRIAA